VAAVGFGNSKGKGYLLALSLGAEHRGKPGHVSATNGNRSVAMGSRVLRRVPIG
jgi:hypothetical protein